MPLLNNDPSVFKKLPLGVFLFSNRDLPPCEDNPGVDRMSFYHDIRSYQVGYSGFLEDNSRSIVQNDAGPEMPVIFGYFHHQFFHIFVSDDSFRHISPPYSVITDMISQKEYR